MGGWPIIKIDNHPIPPFPTKPQKMQRFLQALLLHSDLVELENTFRFPSISPAAWIKRLHPYLVRVARKDPLTHLSNYPGARYCWHAKVYASRWEQLRTGKITCFLCERTGKNWSKMSCAISGRPHHAATPRWTRSALHSDWESCAFLGFTCHLHLKSSPVW